MDTPNKNHEPWLAAFRALRYAHAKYVLEVLTRSPSDDIHGISLEPYAWGTSLYIEDTARAGQFPDLERINSILILVEEVD